MGPRPSFESTNIVLRTGTSFFGSHKHWRQQLPPASPTFKPGVQRGPRCTGKALRTKAILGCLIGANCDDRFSFLYSLNMFGPLKKPLSAHGCECFFLGINFSPRCRSRSFASKASPQKSSEKSSTLQSWRLISDGSTPRRSRSINAGDS